LLIVALVALESTLNADISNCVMLSLCRACRCISWCVLYDCQVVEDLIKFTLEEILNSCQADVDYIQKRVAMETGQDVW